MGTSVLVSEHEYLTTGYEPECEFDHGQLIERNTGEQPHSILLGACLSVLHAPRDPIPGTPPFIAIEILSPEDRMIRVHNKIDEYLAFGVPYVWLIDPEARRADVYTSSSIYEAKDGVLRTENPAIEVPLSELFQALDD